MEYSDKQVKYIKKLKEEHNLNWEEITEEFNSTFETTKTLNAIRKTYKRYEDEDLADETIIKNLEKSKRTSIENKKLKKEQDLLLDSQITIQDLLLEIRKEISGVSFKKIVLPKIKKSAKKKNMIIEPMLSDLHIGLKTTSFDANIARNRLTEYTKVTLEELTRYEQLYNICFFNILLNGDIIQSATMHKDSGASCHLTNAQQIATASDILFRNVISPIANTGHKIRIIGTCGNHDRESTNRFTVNPGANYYTYTIYKILEIMCEIAGYTNVEVIIPSDPYYVYDIFDQFYIVEHGDLVGGKHSSSAMEAHLAKRSTQAGKLLNGIRLGHYHDDLTATMGRFIRGGSIATDDHFSKGLGYHTRPTLSINYYVDGKRSVNYYHTLVVNLED